MSSPCCASLRPHLSVNAIEKIEDPTIKLFVQVDKTKKRTHDWNHHFPLKIFIDEIDRIERQWKHGECFSRSGRKWILRLGALPRRVSAGAIPFSSD
jgi:hypothetical protein